jgi:putative tricarboxylic transport membrane protein
LIGASNLIGGLTLSVLGLLLLGHAFYFLPDTATLPFLSAPLLLKIVSAGLLLMGIAIAARFLPLDARHLLGGLTVTVVAVLFLAYAFHSPNATTPRFMSAALLLVGLAVLLGLVPVHGPRDFYGGAALVMLATLALIASADLPGQRGFAFGPGTAPRLFSFVLAALGAAIAIGGIFADGPPIEKYKIRGPAFVIVSILLFAVMIRGFSNPFGIPVSMPPLGLIPSTFIAFMVSILGSSEMRWVESLIAAVGMTIFCWVLFVILLNLPFQLWPRF